MGGFTAPFLVAVALGAVTLFFAKMIANRRFMERIRAAGMPMPEHHSVFGHFIALKECMQVLPRNTVMHLVMQRMAKKYPNGALYLNLWPFAGPILVVTDPFMASQVEAAFLDKPAQMCVTLDIINGGPSLVTMHGHTCKKWRSILSPGFAPNYMTNLASVLAEEAKVFCELLKNQAKHGKTLQLEEYTLRLTFDVIARITLDVRLHYQTQGSTLAGCLRRQIYWTPLGTTFNPIRRYLTPHPLAQKYNSYRMDRYLDSKIDKRFEELAAARASLKESKPNSRSIISLAMEKYLKEVGNEGNLSKEVFKHLAKPQLRMFLYAGHDTTSSTLVYSCYLLASHPKVLARAREEHDKVFGSDISTERVYENITREPALLNQIPYTQAVIKEVLRIFPPAASMRTSRSGLVITDEQGPRYSTEKVQIWTLSLAMHHSPKVFVQSEEFMPDCWLVGPEHSLYPKKALWRAFEWGPRNCIGQSLAQLELKVALVMTIRFFDITPAYDEWDKLHPRKGPKTVDGNRVYQAEMGGGGAHPADGFPVRVALRR